MRLLITNVFEIVIIKTVLHLGGYKTGSTSVQHFFAANRTQNLLRSRVLYPATGTRHNLGPGHVLLAASLRNETVGASYKKWAPPIEKLLQDLENEVRRNKPELLLVSSEVFLPSMDVVADHVDPTLLRGCLPFNNARLIYYARPQWDAALSKYKQVIRSPAWMFDGGFEEFVEVWLPTVMYDEILRPWVDVFGRDCLILRPYKGALTNVLVDVLQTLELDLPYSETAFGYRANVSSSLAATERLKSFRREAGVKRLTFDEQISALLQFEQDISDDEKRSYEIAFREAHSEVFSMIRERVASSNAKLMEEYHLDAEFFG